MLLDSHILCNPMNKETVLKPRLIELLKHRAVEVRTQPAPPRGRGPDVKLERVPAPALPAWESAEAGGGQGDRLRLRCHQPSGFPPRFTSFPGMNVSPLALGPQGNAQRLKLVLIKFTKRCFAGRSLPSALLGLLTKSFTKGLLKLH